MKRIVLLLCLAGAGWWYFVESNRLSEKDVRDFYAAQVVATLDRKPEELCKLLADDYSGKVTTSVAGQRTTSDHDKGAACQSAHDLYESFDKIGEKMGGIVQLDFNQELGVIVIAPDRRSASIETTFTFDVAGAVMNMTGTSTDVLVRRHGRTLMLSTESKLSLSSGMR
jgi:hypothetical protein